jgi:hypothetical protein
MECAGQLSILQSFGYGISDGLKDFFVQPVIGARKEGGKGFIKGFGKGMGNVVCKPTAGKKSLLVIIKKSMLMRYQVPVGLSRTASLEHTNNCKQQYLKAVKGELKRLKL